MKQGWEIKKLGDCFEYIKNGANIKQERGAGGIPITRIETLSGGIFNRDRLGYADIETIDKYQSYVMESGDLLLSHINSKSYIGRVVVYVKKGDETIIHGMNLLRLKVISDLISPFYMYYYSQTHKFKSQIANRRKDAVNQSSISVADLKTIDVPVPPREEQERIVAELDCLSGVIEKKREQLRELDALAQSIFYQMFGDPITNEKGWDVKKFEDCYKLASGNGLSAKQIIDGDYPVYGGNGIVGYHHEYNLDGNNIIIGRVGALCGNVRNVEGKAFITDNAFILTKKIDNDNVFLLHLLRIHNLRNYAREAMQPVISNSGLKNINIIIAPLALQQQFAEKIEKIEQQKKLISQSIKEVEDLFNSRMDYYFN